VSPGGGTSPSTAEPRRKPVTSGPARSNSDSPSLWDERVDVHDPLDSLRDTVGSAGHDHASIAMPDEHDVAEVIELEVLNHILDMRLEIDRRRGEMATRTEPGERRPYDLVPLRLQEPRHLAPLPATAERPMDDHERRHQLRLRRRRPLGVASC
jgi:hypothetical protein